MLDNNTRPKVDRSKTKTTQQKLTAEFAECAVCLFEGDSVRLNNQKRPKVKR